MSESVKVAVRCRPRSEEERREGGEAAVEVSEAAAEVLEWMHLKSGKTFLTTDAEAANGVVTHSSGNHAAALARAARLRSIAAHIVMPQGSPRSKIRNVESFGGRITFCEPGLAAREAACARIATETGATLVHPFDDLRVMAGQGTAALELLEEIPALDTILCPVGGGGLLCGTAIAAKALQPGIRVIGVEPALADDVAQSFRAGRRIAIPTPATIADGLRTNMTGELNLPLIRQYVDDIVTVTEEGIIAAMRELWENLHLVIEPSAAVPYAALRENKLAFAGSNNNGNFGIGAGAGTAVYMGNLEGERLGGGSGLNEDDIFED